LAGALLHELCKNRLKEGKANDDTIYSIGAPFIF